MERIKLCNVDSTKGIDVENGIVPFVLTERVVDRDSEVIEPNGAVLDAFKKNPVFLWAHDLRQPPIGRVIPETLKKTKERLTGDVQFDLNDPFARLVFEKYASGFLNAGSIRFIPLEWSDETVLPDQKRATYKKWELLEFSAVPVPANPAALAQKDFGDDLTKVERGTKWLNELKAFFENDNFDRTPYAWVEMKQKELEAKADASEGEGGPSTPDETPDQIDELYKRLDEQLARLDENIKQLNELVAEMEAKVAKLFDEELKRVVPYRRHPHAPEGRSWDGAAAVARVRKWASADGSGDKDKMNWSKYAQAFAYVNPAQSEEFGGYKLPHHDVVDGQLVTVWRGVAAAMVALLGGRGGVNVPDNERRGIYNHLAKHYKEFDKPVPDFKDYEDAAEPEDEPDEVKTEPDAPGLDVDALVDEIMQEILNEELLNDNTEENNNV